HLAEAFVPGEGELRCILELTPELIKFPVIEYIVFILALLDFIERRLGNIYVSRFYQRLHETVEECQKQRSDMRTVDIGIRHDYDLVIPCFGTVEILSDTHFERFNSYNDIVIDNY